MNEKEVLEKLKTQKVPIKINPFHDFDEIGNEISSELRRVKSEGFDILEIYISLREVDADYFICVNKDDMWKEDEE